MSRLEEILILVELIAVSYFNVQYTDFFFEIVNRTPSIGGVRVFFSWIVALNDVVAEIAFKVEWIRLLPRDIDEPISE